MTSDISRQHVILSEIAGLVDGGVVRSTLAHNFGTINAANLRLANELVESGASRGKAVLAGF